jgi:hypothetical protein
MRKAFWVFGARKVSTCFIYDITEIIAGISLIQAVLVHIINWT